MSRISPTHLRPHLAQRLSMTPTGSTLIPSLRYRDAPAAIDWLCRVFSLTRHAVYEGPNGTVAHAELTSASGMIMLGSVKHEGVHQPHVAQPDEVQNRSTTGIYLLVPDCDPVYAAVQAANATVVMPLQTMDYGGNAFSCLDPEDHLWSLGEYDPWATHTA